MSPRYFFPVELTKFEEVMSEKVSSVKDDLQEDEMAEKHGDDPRYKQYLEEQRPKVKIVEEKTFVNTINSLFPDDKPAETIPEDALTTFLASGAIILKEEEIKKIRAASSRKGINI